MQSTVSNINLPPIQPKKLVTEKHMNFMLKTYSNFFPQLYIYSTQIENNRPKGRKIALQKLRENKKFTVTHFGSLCDEEVIENSYLHIEQKFGKHFNKDQSYIKLNGQSSALRNRNKNIDTRTFVKQSFYYKDYNIDIIYNGIKVEDLIDNTLNMNFTQTKFILNHFYKDIYRFFDNGTSKIGKKIDVNMQIWDYMTVENNYDPKKQKLQEKYEFQNLQEDDYIATFPKISFYCKELQESQEYLIPQHEMLSIILDDFEDLEGYLQYWVPPKVEPGEENTDVLAKKILQMQENEDQVDEQSEHSTVKQSEHSIKEMSIKEEEEMEEPQPEPEPEVEVEEPEPEPVPEPEPIVEKPVVERVPEPEPVREEPKDEKPSTKSIPKEQPAAETHCEKQEEVWIKQHSVESKKSIKEEKKEEVVEEKVEEISEQKSEPQIEEKQEEVQIEQKEEIIKEPSLKEESIKEPSVKEESIKEPSVKEPSEKQEEEIIPPKEECVEEPIKEESVKEPSVKEEVLKEESIKQPSVKEEPIKEPSVKQPSIKSEPLTQQESIKESFKQSISRRTVEPEQQPTPMFKDLLQIAMEFNDNEAIKKKINEQTLNPKV